MNTQSLRKVVSLVANMAAADCYHNFFEYREKHGQYSRMNIILPDFQGLGTYPNDDLMEEVYWPAYKQTFDHLVSKYGPLQNWNGKKAA